MSHPNHCGALAALFLMFVLSPRAEAERIRTSVPGLNLNYLSIFSADRKAFSRTKDWKIRRSSSAARPVSQP